MPEGLIAGASHSQNWRAANHHPCNSITNASILLAAKYGQVQVLCRPSSASSFPGTTKFNHKNINHLIFEREVASRSVKLLLALASTMILGSKSHGTHDLILLSDGVGSLHN
jgi:hypothetical protein